MSTVDLFRLDGKTAIITGGGRGLGQYFAEALSAKGFHKLPVKDPAKTP